MYLRIGRYLSRILALSVLIWADIGLLVGIALRSPVLRHATTRVAIACLAVLIIETLRHSGRARGPLEH
jgi:hypothetical protein